MAIEIKVDVDNENEEKTSKQESISFSLNARRSLDGNIMIFDHIDIDIVYAPGKKKVLTFAKDMLNDSVYAAQNRMFEYLTKHGVVNRDTVQGGNVYGSMEGQVPEPAGDLDPTKVVMMSISKFLEEEKPYFMYEKAYKDQELHDLVDPAPSDSTELGEVPQAAKKGSIGKLRGYWNV